MNYRQLYIDLVMSRRNRNWNRDSYWEEHHIIPKCLGGSDEKNNLVKLTAKEHYVAHHLLCKFVNMDARYKLQFAFFKISQRSKNNVWNQTGEFEFMTAKKYEQAKLANIEALSILSKELWKDEKYRNKVSKASRKARQSDEYKQKTSDAIKKARSLPDVKLKIDEHNENQRKLYKITTLTNNEYIIKGLGKFANLNGLAQSKLSSVCSGKREQHRGLKVEKILNFDEISDKEIFTDLILDKTEFLDNEEIKTIYSTKMKTWWNKNKPT